MIIETEGLTKYYGYVRALENFSIEVDKGAIGLLGPNGAGKTTLIKVLLGLIKPTRGNGKIFGLDIREEKLKIREKIGFMSENDCFVPGLNAYQYVSYAGKLSGMSTADAKQRAHEVLFYTGLGEVRYRDIKTYSSGMKQRTKLAQVLVNDPKLLFLDEPTTGLDPQGRQEMLALIKDVAENHGINVIFSTHILHDVERVCKEVIILNEGELKTHDNIEKLKSKDVDFIEVRIKGNEIDFKKNLKAKGFKFKDAIENAIRIKVKDERDKSSIIRAAAETNVQLRYMSSKISSLDELFMKLVQEEK